jgi:hypothetical protein
MFLTIDVLGNRSYFQSMFWAIDVLELDFFVVDVLELDVLGVGQIFQIEDQVCLVAEPFDSNHGTPVEKHWLRQTENYATNNQNK